MAKNQPGIPADTSDSPANPVAKSTSWTDRLGRLRSRKGKDEEGEEPSSDTDEELASLAQPEPAPATSAALAARVPRPPATPAAVGRAKVPEGADRARARKADAAASTRSAKEQSAINAEMIGQLDAFLDELAEGHRLAMDQVVGWLTGYGDLENEVQRSVQALNPLLQKWSIEICFLLRMKAPRRFNELRDLLPGIGSRTLSQRLKELELQGIVQRTVYPEVPVRVEYRLTPKGLRMGDLFLPIIAHLRITAWREAKGKPGA